MKTYAILSCLQHIINNILHVETLSLTDKHRCEDLGGITVTPFRRGQQRDICITLILTALNAGVTCNDGG